MNSPMLSGPWPTGLEGNGVGLVRERALASAVQGALERLYRIDRVVDVQEYLEGADEGEREVLLVREADDGAIELKLRVPPLARREFDLADGPDLDPLCQLIEGVSHFVYLTFRAQADREATELELELQAEVDKYVILAASLGRLDGATSRALRARLYDRVHYEHGAATLHGERYRVANDVASRFVRRLERDFLAVSRYAELQRELRRFFHAGQEEKLRATWM